MIFIVIGAVVLLIVLIIGWYMMRPRLYTGNNGTVSGDTYCTGAWGSPDGKTAKNMKCVQQTDAKTNAILECGKSYATHQGLRPTNVYCT